MLDVIQMELIDCGKIATVGLLKKYLNEFDDDSPLEFSILLNKDHYLNIYRFEDLFGVRHNDKVDRCVIFLGSKYHIEFCEDEDCTEILNVL
jgi:hypothetical protein